MDFLISQSLSNTILPFKLTVSCQREQWNRLLVTLGAMNLKSNRAWQTKGAITNDKTTGESFQIQNDAFSITSSYLAQCR